MMRSATHAGFILRLTLLSLLIGAFSFMSGSLAQPTIAALNTQRPYMVALPQISSNANAKKLPVIGDALPTVTAQPTNTALPTATATVQPTNTALPTLTAQPIGTPTPTSIPGDSSQAIMWQRWEQRLSATNNLSDPYNAVDLHVTFRGPDGTTFDQDGFWDGDQTVAIRAMFPAPGTWTWTTSSTPADSGLTQSGSVQVLPASGSSDLAIHGRLTVAPSGRFLTHADGTPFFWLGDTAWAIPLRASDAEWSQYLDTRVAQGFTVIQIALAPTWAATSDHAGRTPFFNANTRQPNPAFWDAFAAKVAAANQRGLVVLVIGLADPLDEIITPGTAEQRFAGQLAARLAGDHVLLAPSFDRPYLPEMDAVGMAIQQAVPQALITQHPGTPSGQPTNVWAEPYTSQPYMRLYGNQTGHNGGDRALVYAQAVDWNLSLWNARPIRPVLNLEAFYDANGTGAGLGGYRSGTALDARAIAYLSLLSGASGYSYGAFGVWGWERDPNAANYWARGLQFPSAAQMGVFRAIFSRVNWWDLVPTPERIANPASGAQTMALASTPDGQLAMAYLPDNAMIQINLDGFASTLRVTWINPSTGERTDGGTVAGSGTHTFTRPRAGDWVLLLQAV